MEGATNRKDKLASKCSRKPMWSVQRQRGVRACVRVSVSKCGDRELSFSHTWELTEVSQVQTGHGVRVAAPGTCWPLLHPKWPSANAHRIKLKRRTEATWPLGWLWHETSTRCPQQPCPRDRPSTRPVRNGPSRVTNTRQGANKNDLTYFTAALLGTGGR